jgi:hypothetical protein
MRRRHAGEKYMRLSICDSFDICRDMEEQLALGYLPWVI